MAITLQCTRCMHEQKIEDDRAEKGVPCKICHHLIKSNGKAKTNAKAADDTDKALDEGIKSGPPAPTANTQTGVGTKKAKLAEVQDDDDDRPRPKAKKRTDRDDDEDDRGRPAPRKRREKEDSSSMMFILLGGGAFVVLTLLCGGVGIGAYALFGRADDKPLAQIDLPREVEIQPAPIQPVGPGPIVNPNPPAPVDFGPKPIPPNPNPFQPENLDPNNPNDIGRVVTLLKGPEQQRGPAYTWLKAASPEHPRRTEVAAILETNVNSEIAFPAPFGNEGLYDSFFRWATKNNVPCLIKVMDKARDGRQRQEAMKLLGKLKDPRAAEPIAARLTNFFEAEGPYTVLLEMGPMAEGAVLKYFNARDARDRARLLIKAYDTKSDAIITQCIADLDSADNDRRTNAVQWFAAAPVDEKRRPEVARVLNKSIAKANFAFERDLAKVLETWGTAENVPALVQRLDANRTFGDGDAIRILGKIRDPNGTKAIVRAMTIFHVQAQAKAALKEIGPSAEPAIVEAMNAAADNNARKVYVNALGEMGTRQSIPALQQIAVRFAQQPFLKNDVDRAIQSINARGK